MSIECLQRQYVEVVPASARNHVSNFWDAKVACLNDCPLTTNNPTHLLRGLSPASLAQRDSGCLPDDTVKVKADEGQSWRRNPTADSADRGSDGLIGPTLSPAKTALTKPGPSAVTTPKGAPNRALNPVPRRIFRCAEKRCLPGKAHIG